jgi:hypothetical protein
MRRSVLGFGVTFVLTMSGLATVVLAAGGDDKTESNEKQDGGVHGGPIERLHNEGACDLTAVSSLAGNWTHGDYVSAVASAGDAASVRLAAHSDCGKPMVAVGHGNGPPAHAMWHKAKGKELAD